MQGYPNLDDHEKAIASTAHVGCRHSKIPAVSKLDIATAMELGMICHICPIPSLETLPITGNLTQNTKCVATPQQLDTLWYSNMAVGCRRLHGRRGLDI